VPPPEPDPDELLDQLEAAAAGLEAAEKLRDAWLAYRNRLVLEAHRGDRPLASIAARASITVQGIGKITRAAGLRRYRERQLEEPG
jgi:hypothetical protein